MNEQIYAVVDGETVVNVVLWDGVRPYFAGDGVTLVPIPKVTGDDGVVLYNGGIGWTYRDGEFVDERPVEEFDA